MRDWSVLSLLPRFLTRLRGSLTSLRCTRSRHPFYRSDRDGTGSVSRELCQYVKRVVGVDVSQGAVDRYNADAANQGLEPDEMRAVCAELTGDVPSIPSELSELKFDVIVVRSSFNVTAVAHWRTRDV